MRESVRMREVWRIGRAGALDRLQRQIEPLPDPGPREARIAVRAIELGALESGDVALLHSAAGGVGLNALAILGARELVHGDKDWAELPGGKPQGRA